MLSKRFVIRNGIYLILFRSDQNGTIDPIRHSLAKLWLKAFIGTYFLAKTYVGDDAINFAVCFCDINFKILN